MRPVDDRRQSAANARSPPSRMLSPFVNKSMANEEWNSHGIVDSLALNGAPSNASRSFGYFFVSGNAFRP
jgi:hypothetical protein